MTWEKISKELFEEKTEKRFTTDNGSNEDVCLVDNLTKKEYESNFEDIVDLMNNTWEQTKRFEKHNQYLEKENEQLKNMVEHNYVEHKRCVNNYVDKIKEVEKENEQLKQSIRRQQLSNEECSKYIEEVVKENEQLKNEKESWLKTVYHFDNVAHNDRDYAKRMYKENKELKKELAKFKEWEKHIRDVKREELDRVFKMSIYEIAEAFEYYKKRIKELEND